MGVDGSTATTMGEAGSATAMTGEASEEGNNGGGRVDTDPAAAAVLRRSSTTVKVVDPVAAAMTTMTAVLLQPPPLYCLATAAWASAGGGHGEMLRWKLAVLAAVVAGGTNFEIFYPKIVLSVIHFISPVTHCLSIVA
uniref:Uncharacterized protein n=1 Tax=Oryza rufipogon TaxID=4529 RepID=A0A0E0P4K9_ORYRU